MVKGYQDHTSQDLADLLRGHGVNPTAQRIEIARLLVYRRIHLTAEDVFRLVNRDGAHVSKATVYNTLGVFAEKGLIREVVIDPTRVVYDSNTAPHHHFYNTETGELFDIEERTMSVAGLPPLPQGTEVEGVEVIVRLRSSADRVA
ncbi:transcriptional repressor [Acidiferrobacter thiooxydans]|uniref:Ferric uptake regulation protein n=1 Tax=Acidiferrobacter thiooxydans TaxID=163359 RepID=A0A368HFX9_9GAMM|nr:transcriptional repressor [Acidiferrobacter thiooxydans]